MAVEQEQHLCKREHPQARKKKRRKRRKGRPIPRGCTPRRPRLDESPESERQWPKEEGEEAQREGGRTRKANRKRRRSKDAKTEM